MASQSPHGVGLGLFYNSSTVEPIITQTTSTVESPAASVEHEVPEDDPDGERPTQSPNEPPNALTREQCPLPRPPFPIFISKNTHRGYVLTKHRDSTHIDGNLLIVAHRVSDNKRFLAHAIIKNSKEPEDPGDDDAEPISYRSDTFDQIQLILPYASFSLMSLFNHPNLIKLVDIVQSSHPGDRNLQASYLVWEDCDSSSLARIISSMTEPYNPEVRIPSTTMSLRDQARQHEGLPEDFC